MSRYAKLVDTLLAAEGPSTTSSGESVAGQVDGLKVHTEGKVFRIEINRPTKLNAITWDVRQPFSVQALLFHFSSADVRGNH